jgi:hypothetical protein
LGDLNINWTIILKWIFKEIELWGMDWIQLLTVGPGIGCSEHVNEVLGSRKGG